MNLNKENKYPEIRFKGFTEAWEQRKAKELCSISTGKGNTQDKVEDGAYPFYVRSATIERSNEYLYDQEAVLTVGDGVGTGKVFHYVNGKYNLHQRVYRMYDFNTVSAKYFYYYFSKYFYRRVMAMTAKTSVDSVRMEMIADMYILFPSKEEQIKVVNFFGALDNTIALHRDKLDKLKNLKKAYLQVLFPSKDSKLPSIRFANFTESWEQRKGSDIFKSVSDKNHPDLPILSASQEKGMILRDNIGIDIKYDKKSLVSYKKVIPEQFVIHLRSFQGGFAYSLIEGITSPAYTVIDFRNKEQHSSLFWKFILSSPDFIKRLETVTYGIRDGRSISYSDFSTLKFNIPTINEQENIERFLNSLDKTIALHQQKLNKLKELKKAFLNKIFV